MDHQHSTNRLTTVMITEETMEKWETKMRQDPKVKSIHLLNDDEVIIWHKYNFKEPYLRILQKDVQRTRSKDRSCFENYNKTLEMLLMFYCEMHIIPYQQGMNEIMGPFLLFHYMFNIPLYRIYNLFSCFTQMFLTNYYCAEQLAALKSSIQLINLLLKYHEPELYLLFEEENITPQMYSTNWLLTTFANKNKIEVLLTLWDCLIEESDELMMHYILIAFLRYHKKEFISAGKSNIPELFTKTHITNCNELITIFNFSKKIKEATPMSFSILVSQLEIFKPDSQKHQELFEKYSIETMIALPLFPSEVLYANFKNIISCPDSKCINFSNKYLTTEAEVKSKNFYENNQYICYCCKKASYPSLNYCLIDLRVFKTKESSKTEGILPLTRIIDNSNISTEGFIEELENDLILLKQGTNFVLITTDDLVFDDESLIQSSNQRKTNAKNDPKEEGKRSIQSEEPFTDQMKERKALQHLMSLLISHQCPFVSYVYGGFKAIHELCLKLSISLSHHQSLKCSLCSMNKELQEFNREEDILYQKHRTSIDYYPIQQLKHKASIAVKMNSTMSIDMFKVLSQNELYKVYHCLLKRLNLSLYDNDQKVILLFDNNELVLLKLQINEGDKLEFPVIELIKINRILKLKRKNTEVTLIYPSSIQDDKGKHHKEKMFKVSLYTNTDSVNFSNEINLLLIK